MEMKMEAEVVEPPRLNTTAYEVLEEEDEYFDPDPGFLTCPGCGFRGSYEPEWFGSLLQVIKIHHRRSPQCDTRHCVSGTSGKKIADMFCYMKHHDHD